MSEVESSERYRVLAMPATYPGQPFAVVGFDKEQPTPTDRFRTYSAAEYAARLLNAGAARVDCHAVLGCKVVER